MIPTCVIFQNSPEILSNFKIWSGISGFSFCWRLLLEFLPEVGSGKITAVILAIFRPSCMETYSLSLFEKCPDLLFSWNSDGGLVLRSSVATINKSPVQLPSSFKAYPLNLRGKALMRRTDALDLCLLQILGTILLQLYVIRLNFRCCKCRSSFDGMWAAIDAEFLFSSARFAVCLYAHLSPNLRPPGALNFVHSGTCQ